MDEKLLQRFIELDAIPAGRSQDRDIQWGETGLLIVSDLAREVQRLREREASYKQEVDDFNAGYAACKAGVPVEEEPNNPSDMWRPGYAWAAFDGFREREARARALLKTLIDLAEVDESEGTLPEDAAELAQKARAWIANAGG